MLFIKKGRNDMPQYVITYLGGNQPTSPEEGKKNMAKYMEWIASLGENAVSPMNPFKNTNTVNSDGSVKTGSSTKMSGYTVINAASMAEAMQMVKDCPFLEVGGTLEVSELIQMPGKK